MLLRSRRAVPSGFIQPCLPSPADRPPSGPDWIHEIKHDGYRLMARRDPTGIRLLTRNGHDWAPRYPHRKDHPRSTRTHRIDVPTRGSQARRSRRCSGRHRYGADDPHPACAVRRRRLDGLLMASARVYVNEGSMWRTWVKTMALNPFDLRESMARNFATKEFDLIDPNSPWMQTEKRMPNMATFLGTYDSFPL